MHSQGLKALSSSIILNGPGNVRLSRFRKNHLTTIQWQVRFDILNDLCLAIAHFYIRYIPHQCFTSPRYQFLRYLIDIR